MRGKVVQAAFGETNPRITPAYAGKRHLKSFAQFVDGDHPRICGEKRSRWKKRTYEEGSPPHMRGKEKQMEEKDIRRGDHPRICGEKTKKIP